MGRIVTYAPSECDVIVTPFDAFYGPLARFS
jgi:hypothetical protein